MPKFRKPIRIHTQGYGDDILLQSFDGRCGDITGPDCIGAAFENERGGFVLSYVDLVQAVEAIRIERDWAAEQEEKRRAGLLSPSEGAGDDK